jgi:hypothetical protein
MSSGLRSLQKRMSNSITLRHNHAVQLPTRPLHQCSNRLPSWAGSLSLGSGGMTRIVSIVALCAATAGCTAKVRSAGTVPYPRDGIHLLYSRDGRLIQKTVWRDDLLMSAWEYQLRQDLPREVVDAVNRGERDWPAPRWIQVAKRGTGRLSYLDEDGQDIGFGDYHKGRFYKGAH